MGYPVFAAGDVLNASDMNAVGLWLVKTQTVGTGVSTVDVTSCFSSTYDNYFIAYSNVDFSVDATGLLFRFGTTASPVTTNYKFGGRYWNYSSTGADVIQSNPGNWEVGGTETDIISNGFFVYGPNLASRSTYAAQYARSDSSFVFSGIHDAATQHTGFYLYPSSGTMTGGTIRVYGYRN